MVKQIDIKDQHIKLNERTRVNRSGYPPEQPNISDSATFSIDKFKIYLILGSIFLVLLIALKTYFFLTLKRNQQTSINNYLRQVIPSPRVTNYFQKTRLSSLPIILKSKDRSTKIINPQIAPEVIRRVKTTTSMIEDILNQLIHRAFAQSNPNLIYRINSSLPNLEQAKNIAVKFGFNGDPEPSNEPGMFKWTDKTKSLVVSNRAYMYVSATTGDLPTEEEAVVTATNFLKKVDLYSPIIYKTVVDRVWSDGGVPLKNHPEYNKALIRVRFLKQQSEIPIIYGDIESENSADLIVVIGEGNKVYSVYDGSFGYLIDEANSIVENEKDVDSAVQEFKETGGAVRWIVPLAGKGWSSSGKYEIKNAVVNKIYKAYYFDNLLGIDYRNDLGIIHNTGYLLPIWIFVGTGNIYGSDYSGDQISFESMIYAIKESSEGMDIFKVQNLDLDKSEVVPNSTASASFNFIYNNLLPPQYRTYRPREGLKFKIEIIYPNKEIAETSDLVRDPNYGEVIEFNSGTQEGDLKVKVSLVDFPNANLEKVVKVVGE